MLWPSFLNAALLGGLVAVGIPILIHLMLKTRQRRMKFSTLRFFDFLDEEAVRSRKLRHWLLLLLRLFIIVLLVFAFARPFLGNDSLLAGKQRPQVVIFLLDRSLSLTTRDAEGVRWERTRAAARKLLYTLPRDAKVGIVACGGHAEWLAQPGPATDALKVLDTTQPLMTGGDLGDALSLAARFFASQGAQASNTLFVMGDFQRTSARRVAEAFMPPNVRVEWFSAGEAHTPNLAVTELNLGAAIGQTSAVMVANFDEEDHGPVTTRLLVDGKALLSRTLCLSAGARSNLDITLPPLPPGWHSLSLRLEYDDPLPADNVRYQALYVPPPVPVLLVEPKTGAKVYQQETFFIRTALDPNFGDTNSGLAGFAVDTTPPDEINRHLMTGNAYGTYALVIVPALKRWPAGTSAALLAHVEKGGGLLLFAGEGLSVNHYTAELGPLLPGHLGASETAADLDWRIWEWDKRSPIFAPFRQPNSGSPSVARFFKRLNLQPREEDQVLARFQDGQTAMLLRSVGRGRVMFFNATADVQWHDWPRHKTFVPWLHSTARFLAGRNPELETLRSSSFLTGTETDLFLGKEWRGSSLKWVRPDGQEQTVKADEQGAVPNLEMTLPGLYSLRDPQNRELRRLAANVPPEESDLAAFTPQEMQARLVRADTSSPSLATAVLLAGETGHREFWRLLLLAGLLLMLTETIIGNRTVP